MRIMEIMNANNQLLINMEQPLVLGLVAEQNWTTAAAPSSYNRCKTGPNAQTDFEPFAPNEQATRNETPWYPIISGLRMKTN